MIDGVSGFVPKFIGIATAAVCTVSLLQGCATKEFRAAREECQPEASRKFPVHNYLTTVTKTRTVKVPTGQTNCTTSYNGPTANTSCQQEMRTEYQNYQELETVDRNEQQRNALVQSCARDLCMKRSGNQKCE
jgi:hypothetical protein